MEPSERVPDALGAVVAAFRSAPASLRLELLLEYARSVPPLPSDLRDDPGRLERVHECQTPFFVASDLEGSGRDAVVRLFFDAPEEAPTTRGFAGILHAGLDGQGVAEVLATRDDFYLELGLAELISPLRLRGMAAILARVKRQVATAADAGS
ncbi:MAG: SufE family protein [Trueperaceae bacterium]|nr:SufE family protein [Trueperaceae bacterium]